MATPNPPPIEFPPPPLPEAPPPEPADLLEPPIWDAVAPPPSRTTEPTVTRGAPDVDTGEVLLIDPLEAPSDAW